MLIIDMPKKYLTDASGFVSCAMCQKYLPLLYRDCHNDFKGCLIKGELPEEHGDLIDRDALKKEISVLQDTSIIPWVKAREYAEIAKSSTLNIIDDQHAVIEAERKDDGTTAD